MVYPLLNIAIKIVAQDNDMIVQAVPDDIKGMATIAETELASLSKGEMKELCSGEESKMNIVAAKCPNAHEILSAFFTGDL